MKLLYYLCGLLELNLIYLCSLHAMETPKHSWWSFLTTSIGIASCAAQHNSKPVNTFIEQRIIDLPSHTNLIIESNLIDQITLLPCLNRQEENTIIAQGKKESLNLIKQTYVSSLIHTYLDVLKIDSQIKKEFNKEDKINIQYFVSDLEYLSLSDEMWLTMDHSQWKNKQLLLKKIATQDYSTARIFNLDHHQPFTLSACHQSTILCSGKASTLTMYASNDANILTKDLVATTINAYAFDYATIAVGAQDATLIAEAEALCSTIIYTGTPKVISKKGYGYLIQNS